MAGRIYTEDDFADAPPPAPRIYSESDFEPIAAPPAKKSTGLDALLSAAGVDPEEFRRGLRTNQPATSGSAILGRAGPSAVGAAIGAIAGVPGAALGGAAGESLRQAGVAASGEDVGLTAALGRPAVEGALAGAGQGIVGAAGRLVGAAGAAAARPLARGGAQVLKATAGIGEEAGRRVLTKLSILFNAPSVRAAGEAIGAWAEKSGLKTGAEAFKEVFKRYTLTPAVGLEAAENVAELGEAMTAQELLASRQAITKVVAKLGRSAVPEAALNQRFLIQQLARADELLARMKPGYGPLAQDYSESIAKEAFNSLLPQNISRTTSVLRVGAAGALGLRARSDYESGRSTAADLMALSMMSPLMVGIGLRGGYFAARIGAAGASAGLRAAPATMLERALGTDAADRQARAAEYEQNLAEMSRRGIAPPFAPSQQFP